MEDGVNGVPTRLVHRHVEEEFNGEQELVQIHGMVEKKYFTDSIRLLSRCRV